MKIGILQAGHVPDAMLARHGDYPELYARLLAGNGFGFAAFPVVDGKFPNSVHDCDGWLITGSRHGAYDRLDWIPRLEDFIRQAYGAGVPLVGICFGHQIMAQALGGKVEKYKGGWGLGKTRYQSADGAPFELHALHQDQVTQRPPEAELIASAPACENAAFAYRGNAISYQGHPEFGPEFMRDIIDLRAGVLPPEQAREALAQLDGDLDAASIGDRIATFFKQSAKIAA